MWTKFRPKRLASITTHANGDKVDTPSPAMMSGRRSVRCGLLLRKDSSEAGRFVMICV